MRVLETTWTTAMEPGHGAPATAADAAAAPPPAAAAAVSSSSVAVDLSLPLPQMKPQIVELCKDMFKKWSCLEDSCFSIETVSGGITNLLLKVSVTEGNGNTICLTVRLYGPNTDLVIDRKRELQALPYLSAAGFGAELLGVFENGMIQAFLNARTLSPSDMGNPQIAAEIASQLHKFHQVEIPGSREPQLWNDIFKFFDRASALKFDDNEKQAKYEQISFQEIRQEIIALKDVSDLLNAPVVFAHNDLLSGNLMRNDEEEKLYFIDFEYGSYSYRGFDIANHFNEYAGYDCDYNLYPDKDAQYHFFRNYLKSEDPHEVPDKDLEALYIETNIFRRRYPPSTLITSVISSFDTTNIRSRKAPASPWQNNTSLILASVESLALLCLVVESCGMPWVSLQVYNTILFWR